MTRRPLSLSALLLAACGGSAIDPDLARVLDEVVDADGLDPDLVRITWVGEVTPDSVVTPAVGAADPDADLEAARAALLAPPAIELGATGSLWLVDPAPDALWSHPATLVVVPDDGGALTQADIDWWPVLDGAPFEPWDREADWGPPIEPMDVGEEPTVTHTAPAGVETRALDATCAPKVTHHAVVLEGSPEAKVRRSGLEMSVALRNAGYAVTRVQTGWHGKKTKDAILSALDGLAARKDQGEVVVYYVGHGSSHKGWWALAPGGAQPAYLAQEEVADRLHGIDAERISLLSESCYSGWWPEALPGLLAADPDTRDVELEVMSTAEKDQSAWLGPLTAVATWKMLSTIGRVPEVDWSQALPGPMPLNTSRGRLTQRPQRTQRDPVVPDLHLGPHPADGRCLAGALDSQDYSRQVNLFGAWFGAPEGTVELEDPDGGVVELDVVYWSDTGISVTLPMRRDGFPSDDEGPGLTHGAGHYRITVERADGGRSSQGWDEDDHPSTVHLPLQVYSQDYAPTAPGPWAELWNPLTPAGPGTDGPTIQASALLLPAHDLEPDLTDLGDTDALHTTSPTLQATPYWGYELLPAPRDLATAYDQRQPDSHYYGFRVGFGDDWAPTSTWRFVLAYD